jgi:hypothetical protein
VNLWTEFESVFQATSKTTMVHQGRKERAGNGMEYKVEGEAAV